MDKSSPYPIGVPPGDSKETSDPGDPVEYMKLIESTIIEPPPLTVEMKESLIAKNPRNFIRLREESRARVSRTQRLPIPSELIQAQKKNERVNSERGRALLYYNEYCSKHKILFESRLTKTEFQRYWMSLLGYSQDEMAEVWKSSQQAISESIRDAYEKVSRCSWTTNFFKRWCVPGAMKNDFRDKPWRSEE